MDFGSDMVFFCESSKQSQIFIMTLEVGQRPNRCDRPCISVPDRPRYCPRCFGFYFYFYISFGKSDHVFLVPFFFLFFFVTHSNSYTSKVSSNGSRFLLSSIFEKEDGPRLGYSRSFHLETRSFKAGLFLPKKVSPLISHVIKGFFFALKKTKATSIPLFFSFLKHA